MSFDECASSSSSSASADNLGITRESPSGIHLCEIDSLEDVFLPRHEDYVPMNHLNETEADDKPWSPQKSEHSSNQDSPSYVLSSPLFASEQDKSQCESPLNSASSDPEVIVSESPQNECECESPGDRLCPHSPIFANNNNDNEEEAMKYWDSDHSINLNQTKESSPALLPLSFWSSFLTSGFTVPRAPSPPPPPENAEYLHDDKGDAMEVDRGSEIIPEKNESEFHVFESITPEPLSEYDEEECDLSEEAYPGPTVTEEFSIEGSIDEANLPVPTIESDMNITSSTESGSTLQIVDTVSEAAIFDNDTSDDTETDTDEEFQETCSISDEPAPSLVAFDDECDYEVMNPDQGADDEKPQESVNLELPVFSNSSSEDIFIDAEDNVERKSSSHYWTCEELSNLVDMKDLESELEMTETKSTQSPPPEELPKETNDDENDNDAENSSKAFESVNRCSRILQGIFQMHVAEDAKSIEQPVPDQPDNQIPTTSGQPLTSDYKDYETIQAHLESLVEGDLLAIPDETRWARNADIVDTICVEIDVHSLDPKDPSLQKVALRFPVHKVDSKSAMVLVNNVHLRSPNSVFVHTLSELAYNVSNEQFSTDGRHLIGQFRIRSALAIPVTFKLTPVSKLELTPSIGIIQPRQKVTVRVHSTTSPQSIGIDRLKIEGILLYAAPFVFNRNRSEDNVTSSDVREFWGKFCGSRFRHAQTKFIPLQIYKSVINRTEQSLMSTCASSFWRFMKHFNLFKVTPKLVGIDKYPKDILVRSRSLSPLGQMIIRRRLSLAMEAMEQADVLNDRRTALTFTALFLLSIWTCFYYYVYLVQEERKESESYQYQVSKSWWNNFVAMHSKVWFEGT